MEAMIEIVHVVTVVEIILHFKYRTIYGRSIFFTFPEKQIMLCYVGNIVDDISIITFFVCAYM